MQQEFVARGLAARDEVRRTGRYVSADEVLAGLDKRWRVRARRLAASELYGSVYARFREGLATFV